MFKVMVVDDMEIMRRQIKRLPLWGEETGFVIAYEAEDGQEALEKLQTEPVDLLITDISMPRVNGIELLKECQERSLAFCVVFLSEHSEFSFARKAIQHGVFDYLVKPVDLEDLKELLKKAEKHIEEKRKAQSSSKDQEAYYPNSQIDSIVKYISEGSSNAVDNVQVIVEEAYAALGKDIIKTALVLQRFYSEVYSKVEDMYSWLDKFIDRKLLSDINLTKFDSIDLIETKLREKIKFLVSITNKLVLSSKKSPLIREICLYVIHNAETDITMAKLSEALFLSKNYIGDIFKQETGITVGEYITMVKMERAKHLIIKEALRNYEIAHRLCYNNVEYFGKLFKKHTGLSPVEFKNTLKE